MKFLFKGLLILLVIVATFYVYIHFKFNSLSSQTFTDIYEFEIADEVANADLSLGERTFQIRNSCTDCHGEDLAGKVVIDDPAMGTIAGTNITPFMLKDYTDEDIVRAIRYGVHKSGRSLRFMPSFEYAHLSKQDLAALVAYIRSVKPVEKMNHENSFGPVAKTLAVFGKIPVMFPALLIDHSKGFGDKPAEAATLEFGKYLAQSCVGCHGEDLRGGAIPGGDPSWPHASNIRLGSINQWNAESFQKFMSDGISPVSGKAPAFPMPTALLQQFNDVEREALWLYLSNLK